MLNFSVGGFLNGFTSALMQSRAASASFWGVSGLCVSDTRVKATCSEPGSTFPVKCGFYFQDNGYPKKYYIQCTVRNNSVDDSECSGGSGKGHTHQCRNEDAFLRCEVDLHAFLCVKLKVLVAPTLVQEVMPPAAFF